MRKQSFRECDPPNSAASTEAESPILKVLRDMRDDFGRLDAKIDTLGADLRSEMHCLGADVASDLLTSEKRVGEKIAGMRRAVMEYHSSAIGHGVLISEFEDRLRRVEQHLNVSPGAAH